MTPGFGEQSPPWIEGWSRFLAGAIVFVSIHLLAGSSSLNAQFSPGVLSQPHSELDDSAHCLKCHGSGKGVNRDRCLSCHQILANRIDSGLGLHAADKYERCETCHIEHHGKDFELVWWGDEGRQSFDHDETGYPVEGAHAKLTCEKCHNPQRIQHKEALIAQGKSLERTFLGLEPGCLSCHQDEHRGQVAADSCLTCHTFAAWMPVSAFEHDSTRFPLTGNHRKVECAKCHTRVAVPNSVDEDTFLQFSVPKFGRCTDCHRDPHEARLGLDCAKCHTTAGWSQFKKSEFDHNRTRFTLEGEHRRITCASCHPAGTNFRVARFDTCHDCHRDVHLGQFADRPDKGACESCHTVDRFAPATFTLQAHKKTDYPLQGAHLAAPCVSCHRAVPVGQLPMSQLPGQAQQIGSTQSARPEVAMQFRFASTACVACHRDPHTGEVDPFVRQAGCESCHRLDGWRQVDFDHAVTKFALIGKHATTACTSCHTKIGTEAGQEERLRMTGASSECTACHKDPHLDQFAEVGRPADCSRCHGMEAWSGLTFDHVRDSRFPLDGAHNRATCGACHKAETSGEQNFIRYTPLGFECKDCHGGFEPFYD